MKPRRCHENPIEIWSEIPSLMTGGKRWEKNDLSRFQGFVVVVVFTLKMQFKQAECKLFISAVWEAVIVHFIQQFYYCAFNTGICKYSDWPSNSNIYRISEKSENNELNNSTLWLACVCFHDSILVFQRFKASLIIVWLLECEQKSFSIFRTGRNNFTKCY